MIECPRCQAQYPADESPAFCGECGTKISDKEPVAQPLADPLVGMIVDGRYRIIDLIGRGGMGAVYRVEHVKMGKIMAMKILHGELSQDPSLPKRFKREAETVSRLTHVNTVSVFDFGSYTGLTYLVMEYIDGQDLSAVLRLDGPLPFVRAAGILIQVCSSLNEAHSKGIVHRDLKPENILVGNRDEAEDFVKVLDFGLAKLRDVDGKTRITVKGSLVGTPYYMAPEHIRGESVDQRSDIYALGAVMYKLLTGETPFSAATPMGVITKHLTEDPEAASTRFPRLELPDIADRIMLKAMNKKPEGRFKSADELRRTLADAIEAISPGSDFRRFSSLGEVSGQVSNEAIPSKAGWNDGGALDRTAPAAIAAAPVPSASLDVEKKQTSTGERTSLSKSVIIGTRKVEIGTKTDFVEFEKKLRRNRVAGVVVGVLLATCAVVAGILFVLISNRDDSNPIAETEPNDTPAHADRLVVNTLLDAHIAGDAPNGDIDWFRLPGPPMDSWAVEVNVTGVPGLDLALQLVDPNLTEPLAMANASGQGGDEKIIWPGVRIPDVFLMVQEVRAPGIPPGHFPNRPYKVVYKHYDASLFEKEPNNTIASATPIRLGATLHGALGEGDMTDWYCGPAGRAIKTVQATGIPGADISLSLRLGPESEALVVNNGGIGQGEGVSLPPGPGPTCVGVGQRTPPDGGTESPISGQYQILFQ